MFRQQEKHIGKCLASTEQLNVAYKFLFGIFENLNSETDRFGLSGENQTGCGLVLSRSTLRWLF